MIDDSVEIVTGDDASFVVTLYKVKNKIKETFEISSSAEVKALLVSSDHKTPYMEAPVAQSINTPGADWTNSLVAIELPKSSTEGIIYQGKALLEIQVSESGKSKTWFLAAKIITGLIP